jgi:predicted transcriptional regulator
MSGRCYHRAAPMNDELHEKTRALLRDTITSFEMLEIVLLMRAQPDESWTAGALASRAHLPDDVAIRALQGLLAGGLVQGAGSPANATSGPQYQYRPVNAGLAAAADWLAQDFTERRAAVLSTLSTNAIERLRSGALNAFADAFVLKPGSKRRDG